MSYQLVFWRGEKSADPHRIYQAFMDDEAVEGIEPLDPAAVTQALSDALPEWIQTGNTWSPNEDGSSPALDVDLAPHGRPQAVVIDTYGLHGEELNPIIDAMVSLDTGLYDPQVPARFDDF